jgi:hypothetical protein
VKYRRVGARRGSPELRRVFSQVVVALVFRLLRLLPPADQRGAALCMDKEAGRTSRLLLRTGIIDQKFPAIGAILLPREHPFVWGAIPGNFELHPLRRRVACVVERIFGDAAVVRTCPIWAPVEVSRHSYSVQQSRLVTKRSTATSTSSRRELFGNVVARRGLIEPNKGTPGRNGIARGAPSLQSRKANGHAAGLSDHQLKQAMRAAATLYTDCLCSMGSPRRH